METNTNGKRTVPFQTETRGHLLICRHLRCVARPQWEGTSALWELPWKIYVLRPRLSASQSHLLKASHGGLGRKTGRTHLCYPNAVDPDLLPRQILKNRNFLAAPLLRLSQMRCSPPFITVCRLFPPETMSRPGSIQTSLNLSNCTTFSSPTQPRQWKPTRFHAL